MIKKLLLIAIVVAAAFIWVSQSHNAESPASTPSTSTIEIDDDASDSEKLLAFAFLNQQSDLQVQGKGTVKTLLKDDTKGSRHQRFIVELSNKQTLLIAHNIDLAPRINAIKVGDTVRFFGEYEWNKKGGVIHWTHHDPKKKHIDGWLKHEGQIYQ